jgi:hypothetical protein
MAEVRAAIEHFSIELACSDLETAARLVRKLLGFYAKRELNDVRTFVAGMGSVFAAYPEEFGLRCVDPVHGLPGTLKFLPSLAEVHDHLEYQAAQRRVCLEIATSMLRRHDRANISPVAFGNPITLLRKAGGS